MPTSELPDPIHKEILNVDEAAAYLGVSTKTFHKVLHEGEMPGRKVGREWKFSRKALETWIANSRSRDFLDTEDRSERVEGEGRDDRPADEEPGDAQKRAAAAAAAQRRGGGGARPGFHEEED